jgi:hypothetical protein
MSGSRGCDTRYSGRSGDWDGEEATALAISWSGPDFGPLGGTEGLEALAGDLVLALSLVRGDDLHPSCWAKSWIALTKVWVMGAINVVEATLAP